MCQPVTMATPACICDFDAQLCTAAFSLSPPQGSSNVNTCIFTNCFMCLNQSKKMYPKMLIYKSVRFHVQHVQAVEAKRFGSQLWDSHRQTYFPSKLCKNDSLQIKCAGVRAGYRQSSWFNFFPRHSDMTSLNLALNIQCERLCDCSAALIRKWWTSAH